MQVVATTLDNKWTFQKPDFRWHGIKKDGTPKYNPSLNKGTNYKTKGTPFSFWKSYYVDDAAFIFLNRQDLQTASSLITTHFQRFGLTVHCGGHSTNEPSKTEAMHIPAPGQKSTKNDTTDIDIDENHFFSFCKKFKYLGTNFSPKLNNSNKIKKTNQPSPASILRTKPKCPQEQQNPNSPETPDLQRHRSKPPHLGLRKLGAEGRRLPQARSLPSQMSPSNAEHHNLPSKRRKDFKQRS
jgi:hypothetical protein